MNCPRCGAVNFRLTCCQCGLLTPRAIEEVRKALAAIRARHHEGSVPDLLRQALERNGILTSEDIDTVLRFSQDRSTQAATPVTRSTAPSAVRNATKQPASRRAGPPVTCDGCGGKNFFWASKCDHCGRALSSATTRPAGSVNHGCDPAASSHAERTTAATPPTISWSPDDLRRSANGALWHVGDVLFGWYRIEAIRSGGFGLVYLCRHIATGEGQAIKTVRRDPLSEMRVRRDMRQEAEVWALLEPHPNVVSCDFVQTSPLDKRLWLGLERIDGHPTRGTTLREWLKHGPIDSARVVQIALGICEAMVHVSTAGFVHGDLKPENLLLTAAGIAKVTDLGLAHPFVQSIDGTSLTIAGTPAYMSPEAWVVGNTPSTAGDVYAFGVILWELLTGSHPFATAAMPLGLAHRDLTPADARTVNPNAPACLSLLAQHCMAKRPEDRPGFGDVLSRIRQEWPAAESHDDAARLHAGVGTMCNRISALAMLGKFTEAERLLEGALRLAPDEPFVHAARIKLFKVLGKLGEARDSLGTLARLPANSSGMLFFKSDALWHLGRYEEALAALNEALTIEPDNGWCLYEKGRLLLKLGRHDLARAAFEDCAVRPTESGIMALVALAELKRFQGHTSEAMAHLTTALVGNPNYEETLYRLGHLLAEMGDKHRALDCARRAVAVNPDSAEGHLLEAELLESSGRTEEAETKLRALAAQSQTAGVAAVKLGLLLQKTGRAEEAVPYFRRAAAAQPRNSQEYYLKACVLGPLFEQWRQALACLEAALVLEPASVPALTLKADGHTYFGELDRARKAYEEAQVLRPHDRQITDKQEALDAFAKAQSLVDVRPGAALEAYSRAVELQPTNVAYLFSKAMTLAAMQRPGEALPLFDKGFELMPNAVTASVRWMKIQCLQALYLIREAQDMARTTLPLATDTGIRSALAQLLQAPPPSLTCEQLAAHWCAQGIEAQKAGKFQDATELMRRAVYIAPSRPEYIGALAGSLVMKGVATGSKRDEAEGFALFDQSLKIQTDPSVLFNYAQGLHMVGRLGDALRVAEELLTITPEDPHLMAMVKEITSKQLSEN